MGEASGADAFERFLRSLLGDEAGSEAARSMREQGFDPAALSPLLGDPAQMGAVFSQLQYLFAQTDGPVNWSMARDVAKQTAFRAGDPPVTAAQSAQARRALSVADLWLDPVTRLSAPQAHRSAWTRAEWIDKTLPQWRTICEPVAKNATDALSDAMASQLEEAAADPARAGLAAVFGRSSGLLPKLAALMFAMQIGQVLAALSEEALGSTDVGVPLGDGTVTTLVTTNVHSFGEGLDIGSDEVEQFLAVRECAHARLFTAVPWLRGELLSAVARYSAEIAIDMDAVEEAASHIDPRDPSSVNKALQNGIFTPNPTPAQQRALERMETILALVEGWVEDVTGAAVAPYLPHADQLREMMRRRRAQGSAGEQMLERLIGLQMRPRRARDAATLFDIVGSERGRDARDDLWSHPDVAPTARELDDPEGFLAAREHQRAKDAGIDADLNKLLSGTLGWADGLSPSVDPESDSLRRAGFAPGAPPPDRPSEEDEKRRKGKGGEDPQEPPGA